MSDPSTLLLLTCANCLSQSPQSEAPTTTNVSCVQPSEKFSTESSKTEVNNCISPPEVIAAVPVSNAQRTTAVTTPLLKVGSEGEAVTTLQTKLQQLGYYTGTVDGRYGLQTKTAVAKFQQAKGLKPDGIAGALTWTQLPTSASDKAREGTKENTQPITQTQQQAPILKQPTTAPSPKPEVVQQSSVSAKVSPPENLPFDVGVTLNSFFTQPQLYWVLGGTILFVGGVAFFLILKPSGNEVLSLARLKLEGVATNFPSGNTREPSIPRPWQFTPSKEFDQSVILQQSPIWLQVIVWGIVGVTSFTIIWACVAQVEEAIPAQGQLEPQGTVKNMQAPVGGVVKELYVQEGQPVKAGDLLLSFDQTAAKAQMQSLQSIRASLLQENEVYRRQMRGDTSPVNVNLPSDLALLTQNRAELVAENQLYQTQLSGGTAAQLSPEQRQRLLSSQSELNSRVAASELVVRQLEKQLEQNRIALVNARKVLAVNQEILNGIAPLLKEGAIARVQFLNQQQEVSTRQAEVDRLIQEGGRLELEIAQSKEKLLNTVSASRQDIFVKIDDNKKRIAEIDSQLSKALVENEKRLSEINSQMSQTQQTLRYQDLRAPANGTVFDLKATNPGFVANTSEPILKIVPNDNLVAEVFITNQHIGFVKPGMEVDVRTDTFPYSEFGDIKGELVTIGSDALPPDQVYPFYRFPAKIRLQKQTIVVNSREVPLQSGMSVNANIKIRKRTVMSIFTSMFTEKLDAIKTVR